MMLRLVIPVALLFSIAPGSAFSQDQNGPAAPNQTANGAGGRYGRRGGGGGFGNGLGMGRGLEGTVTETAADHFTIKTDAGEIYIVRYSANTRLMKQPPGGGMRDQSGAQSDRQNRGQGAAGMRGSPPQEIKASDVKVGAVIGVMSDPNEPVTNKTVGAVAVIVMDPQTVQRMREMQANFGKTWLAGKVTAIADVKITITGAADNATHTIVADESTTFRKRRDPVTLADIQVGDTIRVDGALKDGTFIATAVNVMGRMNGGGPALPQEPTQP